MKKIILLLFITALMLSCRSKEDKALALIDKDMFRTLFDYSSYEPIETKVDSAFTSIYRDPLIKEQAVRAIALFELHEEIMDKVNEAFRYAKIYEGNYYLRSEFNKYIAEANSELENARVNLEKLKMVNNSIVSLVKDFVPIFIGWEVRHRFRCKNRGGNFLIGDYLYIIDEKFKEIIYRENLDDEDIQKIRECIDDAIENEEENDDW